ncbi:MAG: bifunctional UDP-sugar hydrolase/5'-nucleotidase [Bacteroidota bacterium]
MTRISITLMMMILLSQPVAGQKLTILHTNDLHSRLMGFSPESDYTPLSVNDDQTVGGFARIATLITEYRNKQPESLLVLNVGDGLMGTIFQTAEAETGFQLRLMQKMGYDVVSLGNHEFDFGVGELAGILAKSAEEAIPQIVLSNISFDPNDPADDKLEGLYKTGVIKTWRMVERNSLRIGIFALMGLEAAYYSPLVKPVSFTDPVEKAREMTEFLKESEHADLVICLSHSGLEFDPKKGWTGEDVNLATKVPGIDVIISGHNHIPLVKPVIVNGIPIVVAGCEGRYLGKLEIEKTTEGIQVLSGELIPVNDRIPGDPSVHRMIMDQQGLIGERLLKPHGFDIGKPVVETSFDLHFNQPDCMVDSNLGPLLADAVYSYLKPVSPADVVLVVSGLTCDEILKGQKGFQMPADLFRIMPMGLGVTDHAPGYSISKIYVTGKELKTILDVMLIAPSMAPDNFPFWSGVRFKYNSLRMPLDRVYAIELGNETDGYKPIRITKDDSQLYSIAANSYVLNYFGLIKEITKGILTVVPKNADGTPIPDLELAVIDRDPIMPGIQEVKEWAALLAFASQFPDLNGNGIPDIPLKYKEIEPHGEKHTSINPASLFKATNGISVLPVVLGAGIIAGIALLVF